MFDLLLGELGKRTRHIDAEEAFSDYRDDPVAFEREVLGQRPWSKQVEILESVRDHRITAVRSCHGAGKSHVAAAVALWFLYAFPGSLVITTAPTDRQVRAILWKEIRTMHRQARRKLAGRMLTKSVEITSDWRAFGFATRIPDNLQGLHAADILVIVDEAAGVLPEIWDAISALLTSEHARELAIGNPTDTSGEFYKLFRDPGAHKIAIGADDTPNFTEGHIVNPALITPEWAEERRRKWGEDSPMYIARVLGRFPTASSDSLIPLSLIEAAQERDLTVDEDGSSRELSPVEIGADIARYGNDRSTIYLHCGPVLRLVKAMAKQDTMETTGDIVQARSEHKPERLKVDGDGLGAGVIDRLRELKVDVDEVHGGAQAKDPERFVNLRAEGYAGLRDRFIAGDIDIDPKDEDLASELAQIRYKVDSRGRIQIESKDEMRKRGLSSPDHADGAMYAFVDIGKQKPPLRIPTMTASPSTWQGVR